MLNLLAASAVFILMRRLVSGTRLRGVIVRRLGEGLYLQLFSLVSLLVVAWMWLAYVDARSDPSNMRLFASAPALHVLQWPLQLAAVFLITAGLTTRNPTIAGLGKSVRQPDIARGVLRITRHPFLWGMALFAAGHMLVAADGASWIFFGTLLVVALTGTLSIDAKRQLVFKDDWDAFASRTSNVPFGAVLHGHQRVSLGEIGWPRMLSAIAIYVILIVLHPYLFGGAALR